MRIFALFHPDIPKSERNFSIIPAPTVFRAVCAEVISLLTSMVSLPIVSIFSHGMRTSSSLPKIPKRRSLPFISSASTCFVSVSATRSFPPDFLKGNFHQNHAPFPINNIVKSSAICLSMLKFSSNFLRAQGSALRAQIFLAAKLPLISSFPP